MYFSARDLSDNRQNVVQSALQASSAWMMALGRMSQLAFDIGHDAVAIGQRHLLSQGGQLKPEVLIADYREQMAEALRGVCEITSDAQRAMVSATEQGFHGLDHMMEQALNRDLQTVPMEGEALVKGVRTAWLCADQTLGKVSATTRQVIAQVEEDTREISDVLAGEKAQ